MARAAGTIQNFRQGRKTLAKQPPLVYTEQGKNARWFFGVVSQGGENPKKAAFLPGEIFRLRRSGDGRVSGSGFVHGRMESGGVPRTAPDGRFVFGIPHLYSVQRPERMAEEIGRFPGAGGTIPRPKGA